MNRPPNLSRFASLMRLTERTPDPIPTRPPPITPASLHAQFNEITALIRGDKPANAAAPLIANPAARPALVAKSPGAGGSAIADGPRQPDRATNRTSEKPAMTAPRATGCKVRGAGTQGFRTKAVVVVSDGWGMA